MFEAITAIATESFILLARMAPYLLFGILVAGAMHVLIPVSTVARQLGGPGLGPVLRAAAIGVPLPICSCGVVPVAASLKKSGASNGAVVSFLVTTPTSGIDSILATYSLMGAAMAVVRVVVTFLIGLAAGAATALGLRNSEEASQPDDETVETASENGPEGNPFVRSLEYGFIELMGGIARPLAIGILLGGLIAWFLPAGVIEKYVGTGFASYLVMLVVGIPMYVCASGSIPLAAALLIKGISPGAAMVFLIAGPATNAATVTVVSRMLGPKTLAIYLSLLILGALAAGIATDAVFIRFPDWLPDDLQPAAHGDHGPGLFEIVSGIFLGLLMAWHLAKQVILRFGSKETASKNDFTIEVKDMNCENCVRTISQAVSKAPGVRDLRIDLQGRCVGFDLDEGSQAESVARLITDAGFHPGPPKCRTGP